MRACLYTTFPCPSGDGVSRDANWCCIRLQCDTPTLSYENSALFPFEVIIIEKVWMQMFLVGKNGMLNK